MEVARTNSCATANSSLKLRIISATACQSSAEYSYRMRHHNVVIAVNGSQFANELDDSLETLFINFFFGMGAFSSVLSAVTVYLIVKKSSFLMMEVRILLLILQISAFLNNFDFCVLFVPFVYPYIGGGFCMGVLCMLGVGYHYGQCFWILTVILLCASFITLLFAKLQTLLHPWSRIKLKLRWRMGFYIYSFSSMLLIPILFLFMETPIDLQEASVRFLFWKVLVAGAGLGVCHWKIQYQQLDWIADKRVYSIFAGCCDDRTRLIIMWLIIYSIIGNLVVFGTILIVLFVLILHKIITPNINLMSNHAQEAHRAKIKNSIVILSQMIAAFSFGVVPICLMMATIGTGVGQEIEKKVLLCEVCMSFLSPLNSIIFIFGNKQYVSLMREIFKRPMRSRGRSFSIAP